MKKLKQWLAQATAAEKEWLAKKTKTSLAYLRQIASGHRIASADIAGRIEDATEFKATSSATCNLPVIRRGELAPACRNCPYYKAITSPKN